MDLTVYALPAILALFAKAVIYFYARSSRLENLQTRLYLFFLFALSVQNLAEVFVLTARAHDMPAPQMGTVYFGASIIAVALLVHLAWVLGLQGRARGQRWLLPLIYGPALVLEVLLWATPLLVAGFEPIGYTYTRIPGPLYGLFEAYSVGYLLVVVSLLAYGAFVQITPSVRTKNQLMLLGILPPILVVITVIAMQHVGVRIFNTTFVLPIALTFLLAVTAYATHQHRLFDIEFFIPGSKVRARKTVFYGRIQSMIAEIADLDSVEQAVRRLADTLGCGVALIGGNRPVLAQAGATAGMAQLPRSVLTRFDRIVVANEIADTLPDVYKAMRAHGVAAVVPFHPHSQHAAGWLVLGDAFSEQVYTARDFRLVEQLFDKMADLFLDKLVAMRVQLADAARQIRLLERRQEELRVDVELLQQQNVALKSQNEVLRKQQRVDSLAAVTLPADVAPRVCILGRDKAMVKALRRVFPQATQYVGAASAGFRRQGELDLLIAQVAADDGAAAEALALAVQAQPASALLVYGAGAEAFARENDFGARLVEALPAAADTEAVSRRAQALAELQRAMHAVTDPERPLLGRSEAYTRLLTELRRLAGLRDPLVLQTADAAHGLALARFVHRAGGEEVFGVWRGVETVEAALVAAAGGSLAVEWGALDEDQRARFVAALQSRRDVRALIVARPEATVDLGAARPFAVAVPTLPERRADLPLLVHYYTLTFNRQTGGQRYLRQAEVDAMLQEGCPATLDELRHLVHARLLEREPVVADEAPVAASMVEKTLDQHLAEYEAMIIQQTLTSCGGNKSQAARLLGLRPNTLHYKLARYARLKVDEAG